MEPSGSSRFHTETHFDYFDDDNGDDDDDDGDDSHYSSSSLAGAAAGSGQARSEFIWRCDSKA